MAQLFVMTNLFLKFQTCNFIFVTDTERDEGTSPKQDAPFFKVGGINSCCSNKHPRIQRGQGSGPPP